MSLIESFFLGIVEGLTEFLPVSSTAHLILVSKFFGIESTPFHKTFEVVIQVGTILAVVFLFWDKIKASKHLWKALLLAFLPTAIIGFLLRKKVDEWLDSTAIVAWSLLLGGFVFLWVARKFIHRQGITRLEEIPYKTAFLIGVFQCLAMVPGVSRSGATLIAGIMMGLSAVTAAEFSFLLAVPTLGAASAYKMLGFLKNPPSGMEWLNLLVGFVVAGIVGGLTIRWMLRLLQSKGLFIFGIYRIILGITVLLIGV